MKQRNQIPDFERYNHIAFPSSDDMHSTDLKIANVSVLIPDEGAVPWVSIVTTSGNVGNKFHEMARAVLHQTLQHWEWVIVNDGATSLETLAILHQYRQQDSRIHVIDLSENRGVGVARNVGVARSRASLVLQLDGQCLLESTTLEKLAWYLEARPEFAYVTADILGNGQQPALSSSLDHRAQGSINSNQITPAVMFRRAMHEAVGGYDESVGVGLENTTFWQRCINAGYRGATIAANVVDSTDATSEIRQDWPFNNPLATSRRNLLFIVPWMALGGADKFNLDLIEQLRARGWDITVVSTRTDNDLWSAEYVSRTPDVFALHRFLPLRDFPRFIAYLIQSRQSDAVLISHSDLGYRLLPYLRGRFPNVAFLDYLHVIEPTWNQGGFPRLAVDYRAHLDFSVTSSEHVREWISTRGIPVDQTAVCYTAVDSDRHSIDPVARHDERHRLNVADDEVVILFVGRLCAQKNPAMLIAALDRLFSICPNAIAWIVGDGPDRAAVEADVAKRGLSSRIQMMHAVSPDSVGRLMSGADIFFLPSRYEGISLALYEAMARGLPLVASDVGGQRELVTAETGVLVQPTSFDEDLDHYVSVLHDLVTDTERRHRLGTAARERVVAKFALENMGIQMAQFLETACRRRVGAPRLISPKEIASNQAAQAIELTLLANRSEWLWNSQRGASTRERVYIGLQRFLSPAYEWAAEKGWRWVPAVGGRVRRFLLR